MLKQLMIDNRGIGIRLMDENKHLGLGHILTEQQEGSKLVRRIALELDRFLISHYLDSELPHFKW